MYHFDFLIQTAIFLVTCLANPFAYYLIRKSYSNFANSTSYSTYIYNQTGAQAGRWTSYNETYEITDVRFRSKVTDDNAWKYDTGYSEWESIRTSNSNAAVRAGNGYELEIDVRYSSNALVNPNRSSESGRGTASLTGTRQSNSRHKANLYKDIYVRTHDGQVYSATGMFGTEAAFTPTIVTDQDGLVRVTYKMRTITDANGNSVPYRIYTNETAKDGSYDLRIWTPTITGFGHGDKPTLELCDSHSSTYQVKGSMYDDLQDSIIQ